ncbi:hypothetical protein [Amycolatopsis minnesotensis]|uniref:hypothetical protein n=1 Tax=Amycolatopsis minnesotensis TaxID=337894 RepID=UPI0031DD72F4
MSVPRRPHPLVAITAKVLDCDQRTRRASRLMLTAAGCVTLVLIGVGILLAMLPVPTYVTAGAFTAATGLSALLLRRRR